MTTGFSRFSTLIPAFFILSALAALPALTLPTIASPSATIPSVLTQDEDNQRTGANLNETILTPSNVTTSTFGKLFTRTLDADVNGQVLYVPGLNIGGAVHNVIFAYTSDNSNGSPCSLYAFDADNATESAPLWHTTLPNSAEWTTCTPVIDPSTDTLYVLTKTNTDSGNNYLRAFDLLTGVEMPGSPKLISASVPGTGDGSVGGVVTFNTAQANCRAGLLFLNGDVYLAFAHNSDSFPYHGWVFGYHYDGNAFTQTAVFCVNPNGGLDGIWMAGKGMVADANNNIYTATGNGTFDINTGGTSYGMSYLKLSTPSLGVLDYFTPNDELNNSNADLDLNNSGLVGIPGTTRLFGGGTKFGSVFLLDSTNMGHFTPGGPDKSIQRFDNVVPQDSVGQNPVCWDAGTTKYVYLWANGAQLQEYIYDTATGKFSPAGIGKKTSGLTDGGALCVSASGSSSGILWAADFDGALRAFNAADVSQPELWDSLMNSSRDSLGSVGHFQFPVAVNGKVYVPTGNGTIAVYGLLSNPTPVAEVATGAAYVEAGTQASTNFGTSKQLLVSRATNDSTSTNNNCAYVQFNLSNITQAPASAKLYLSVSSASTPANAKVTVNVYTILDSWSPSTITWNNGPGLNRTNFTSHATLITSGTATLSSNRMGFDVSSFVHQYYGRTISFQILTPTVSPDTLIYLNPGSGSTAPILMVTP